MDDKIIGFSEVSILQRDGKPYFYVTISIDRYAKFGLYYLQAAWNHWDWVLVDLDSGEKVKEGASDTVTQAIVRAVYWISKSDNITCDYPDFTKCDSDWRLAASQAKAENATKLRNPRK